ncbi:MAG: ketopantoate reductase family protein [Candidatus Bathyarchaeia archaeon]
MAVVGSGAMGSLFGGMLAEAGEEVTLVDIWEEHVKAINENGLRVKSAAGARTIKVAAATDPGEVGTVDLVLIFVKSYDTERAARDALPMASEDTVFLTLQNGLGNAEKISEVVGGHRVVAGVTAQASTLLGPGAIYHAGVGATVIGELNGATTARISLVKEAFDRAGIATEVSGNVRGAIWLKVLVNVGINALTALTGLRNGELLEFPEIREVMRRAVLEALEVAEARGVKIVGDPVEKVYEVAEATATNRSSMLQDIDRGRRTEIGSLNGAIVEIGRQLGVDTPVNEALTAAVMGLEYVRAKNR